MNRAEFEELRDLPGKRIVRDIILKRKKEGSVVYASGAVPIESDASAVANLYVEYNDATESKTINVMIVGVGPICRLDVDGKVHRPAGRSHKHSLRTPECPSDNLPLNVIDRSDLSVNRCKRSLLNSAQWRILIIVEQLRFRTEDGSCRHIARKIE
jgi:hypothetical protein